MKEPTFTTDAETGDLIEAAWRTARSHFDHTVTMHVPGMFVVNGRRGKYRAVSITGPNCDLGCDHCKASLLRTMPRAENPRDLVRFGIEAAERADHGILVTGGCDGQGRLPWREFIPAIAELKSSTGLKITAHTGILEDGLAVSLKAAGVDQALVDVIGDDDTARKVYHLEDGTAGIRRTLDSLAAADLEIVPHIVFGINYGTEKGEMEALGLLGRYPLRKYVVVVLMPTRGTPMADVTPPRAGRVARFISLARLQYPELYACLGCARPRGRYGRELDTLAVRAGVNAVALPSDQAVAEAGRLGLEVVWRETCCSLGPDLTEDNITHETL